MIGSSTEGNVLEHNVLGPVLVPIIWWGTTEIKGFPAYGESPHRY